MNVPESPITSVFDYEVSRYLGDAERMLQTAPPDVSLDEAADVLKRCYGVDARLESLSGERDRNFLATGPSGWTGILKFYNSADDSDTRALQNEVLRHAHGGDSTCPVPELVLSPDGRKEVTVSVNGTCLTAILLSRLEGTNPSTQHCSPALRRAIGRSVGQLSRALEAFDHPRARRVILWDLMLVGELRPLCALLESPARRQSITEWLDRFRDDIRPLLKTLPHQTIHNDLSLSNVLVDPDGHDQITGIIDFGDVVHAPRINEFAIAASYFVGGIDDPVQAMADIIKGIGPDLKLLRAEIEVLPDLVQARLVTRILLSGWRAKIFPENRDYILRSNHGAWTLWDRMQTVSAQQMSARLLDLCAGDFDEG